MSLIEILLLCDLVMTGVIFLKIYSADLMFIHEMKEDDFND